MIFRSASTSSADALISMKNVKPMIAELDDEAKIHVLNTKVTKDTKVTKPILVFVSFAIFVCFVFHQCAANIGWAARHAAGSVQRPFADVRLVLRPEQLHRRQHGRRRRVAERAQRLADDVVGDAEQQVEILRLPFPALEARQQLEQPVAALAARRALAARLVAVEVQQVHRQPHHADRVVRARSARRSRAATRPSGWRSKLAGVSS